MQKSKIYFLLTPFLGILISLNVFAQETRKPNVIFIMCDDLNDYEGVFGGHPQAKTPNIDKLAATGVQFVNAQSNVPVCQPSRNSLFTGVYPHDSKDFGWTDHRKQAVLKNNKTLMKLFQENGYKTLGTGKLTHGKATDDWNEWGMKEQHNYGPFFFDGKKTSVNPSVPSPYNSIGPIDGSFGRLSDGGISEGKWGEKGLVYGWDNKPLKYINDDNRDLLQDELHAQWAVSKLKDLEKRETEQPFFMGIGFVRPHTPLHAPDKYFDMFPLDEIQLDNWLKNDEKDTYYNNNFEANKDNKGPKYYKMLLESYGGNREIALKHFLQAYLACVTFVDEQIGKVVDALNRSKFKENTIVVFTSDHGWQMGEKSYLFKNSPWEESARIPLIIKTPETKGEKVEHPVSLIDIYPTLMEYCSLQGDTKLNSKGGNLGGFSLLPFLENSKTKDWSGPNGALTVVGNYGYGNKKAINKQNYSYRTQRYRYILYGDGSEELYDHKKDPYEWKNIAHKKSLKKIKKSLKSEMLHIIKTR
tara:strand:+ start:25472 stop:27055 length:1584 start_codon:yes stop_codon:yes gene_type:complete